MGFAPPFKWVCHSSGFLLHPPIGFLFHQSWFLPFLPVMWLFPSLHVVVVPAVVPTVVRLPLSCCGDVAPLNWALKLVFSPIQPGPLPPNQVPSNPTQPTASQQVPQFHPIGSPSNPTEPGSLSYYSTGSPVKSLLDPLLSNLVPCPTQLGPCK